MRISKDHDERRNEILDTAAELFESKGYNKTTINDILNKIGIAKGTFYYYFKSKEEVLDAIIKRLNERALMRSEQIKERVDLDPVQKLLQIILALRMEEPKSGVMDELHKPENALMHQKTLTGIVNGLTPILTDIVDEGIQAGVFSTPYPKETIQIMLTAALTLTDEGIFSLTDEEKQRLLQAIIYSLETLLGAKPGSFEPVLMALLG